MTSHKFEAESLIRFAKKVSFPAILAIPLIGGAVAASWSTAETAQAEVEPAGAPAPAATPLAASGTPMETSADAEGGAASEVPGPTSLAPATEDSSARDSLPGESDAETASGAAPALLQQAALTPADEAAEEIQAVEEVEPEPATIVREITVAPGDTLMNLLIKAGAERVQAHQAVTAMEPVYSPRRLMPGQELKIAFADSGAAEPGALLSISFSPSRERDIEISRSSDSDEFFAESIDRPVARQLAYAEGSISSSLSVAASDKRVPNPVLVEAIRAYSYDVDFQREIQKGDSFEFLYEIFVDEEGALVRTGDLLYAAMTLSGSRTELFYYERADGSADFYTADGSSVRRSLMRTPIDGARLSSGFGMRKHPILGYSKMHRGTDFAAPRGTPIYAAGNGVVEFAGRKGGYGKYVRIRHGGSYMTAYAHMKGFAKGIKKGARVKQGQVIGYVGTTGRSTGPHLHYEVMVDGKQVNPLKVAMPRGEKLKKAELADFASTRSEIERQIALAQGGVMMVQRACEPQGEMVEQGSAVDRDC
ncbi:M23 family metallopeptidase [Pelagibius marinus]|uniref:M23 family metallopeptidase n=1 Tax=Pelagibius marinus TaxID=2762760 RepID=UPI00187278BB|nr:M23 family metallopeptidase [Pelagibius marinus]